jgi:hypothetical protein
MGGSGVRMVERTPRVVANRNCCFVGLDVAGSASLRRKTAVEATMMQISDFYSLCCEARFFFVSTTYKNTVATEGKKREKTMMSMMKPFEWMAAVGGDAYP